MLIVVYSVLVKLLGSIRVIYIYGQRSLPETELSYFT